MTNWYGLLVPSSTPRDVVAKLQHEVARAMNLDDTKDLMARSGMRVIANTPQQFAEFLSREMVKYERVIKLARIKEE